MILCCENDMKQHSFIFFLTSKITYDPNEPEANYNFSNFIELP